MTTSPVSSNRLPPGPSIALLQMPRYIQNPYAYHRAQHARFGDTYRLQTLNGPVVFTRDSELIRQLFTLEASQFQPFAPEVLTPLVGKHSLLLIRDEAHKRERKLLMPPFHGARMRTYGKLMQDAAHKELDSWQPGQTLKLQSAMQRVSLQVILRAVFGILDDAQANLAEQKIIALTDSMNPVTLFFPFLQRDFLGLGVGPWPKLVRARAELDELLFSMIRSRRAGGSGDDILSLLLASRYEDGSAMDDEHVRDELLTLLLAGHETSALGLSWLAYFLYRQPETLAKLRAELAAAGADAEPEQLAALPYLDAVCHEALRIFPIVAEVFRTLREPVQLGPWLIPAGHTIGVSIWGLHHRPDLYPDGDAFRPERFLERKFSPFEFVPFGGGIRRCIGAALAMYEMKLVTAALVSQVELRSISDAPISPELRGITIGPRDGLPMRYIGKHA